MTAQNLCLPCIIYTVDACPHGDFKMKWAFMLLSVVSLLSGFLTITTSFENLPLLVSGIFSLISGFAWYLISEMWEEMESVRPRLLRLETEIQTEPK